MELALVTYLLVIALAFANGTNNVLEAMATLVGSNMTDYRTAIWCGAL